VSPPTAARSPCVDAALRPPHRFPVLPRPLIRAIRPRCKTVLSDPDEAAHAVPEGVVVSVVSLWRVGALRGGTLGSRRPQRRWKKAPQPIPAYLIDTLTAPPERKVAGSIPARRIASLSGPRRFRRVQDGSQSRPVQDSRARCTETGAAVRVHGNVDFGPLSHTHESRRVRDSRPLRSASHLRHHGRRGVATHALPRPPDLCRVAGPTSSQWQLLVAGVTLNCCGGRSRAAGRSERLSAGSRN
jgi:hypothetical protein